MITCKKCNKTFPFKMEVDGKMKNLGGRKYCLDCSPFNQKNTRQLHISSPVMIGKKYCPRCKKEKDKNCFYLRRNDKDFSSYCKRCTLDETVQRLRKFKQLCVDYKGGKCQLCEYKKYIGSLHFHHRDPSKKEFSISQCRTTVFSDKIKRELDKCDILCSNCHTEEHNKLLS